VSESIAAAVPADIKKGHQLLGQANRQLRIGEVALRTELSVRTVRHYHEVGLVEPSARSAGGFRLYTENDVQRLLVIRRMKPLGFTLAEMRQLLDSLAVLRAEGATEEQRAGARALLGRYRQKTRDSAERLRRQLAYADELSDLLADAVATTPGPVS
jgi:MerR family transcriptional regulator, copper efflux regulator